MELDVSRVVLSVVIMAGVTYLLRMLPVTIFRKKIENRFVRSFLAYVPYAVLAAMTIPDIFFCNCFTGFCGLGVGCGNIAFLQGKKSFDRSLGGGGRCIFSAAPATCLKRWGIKTESVSIAADSPALSFVFFTEKPTGSALFFCRLKKVCQNH